jgi:hypothetical protein
MPDLSVAEIAMYIRGGEGGRVKPVGCVSVRQCGIAAVRGAIGDAAALRVTSVMDLSFGHGRLFEGIQVIDQVATPSRLAGVQ